MRDGSLVQEPRDPKPVLLMLGRMRCRYSLDELREIDRLARARSGRGPVMLAVIQGRREDVGRWVRAEGLTVRVLVDPDDRVLPLYAVRKTPDIYLIAANGTVAYHSGGGFLSADDLKPLAEDLLAGKGFGRVPLPRPGAG